MARVKIKVERGNGLQQVVVVDTEATKGATIGTNVFNADGTLYVPGSGGSGADIRNGYGILISGTSPKTINVNRAANFAWQGQHSWEKPLHGPNGTAALPAFTFASDPDTGAYRVGDGDYGIAANGVLRWQVNGSRTYQNVPMYVGTEITVANDRQPVIRGINTLSSNGGFTVDVYEGAPFGDDLAVIIGQWYTGDASGATPPASGARGFEHATIGTGGTTAFFEFRRYANSSTPQVVWGVTNSIDQFGVTGGSSSVPGVGFLSDPDTGIASIGTNQLGLIAGGSVLFRIDPTFINLGAQLRAIAGTASAPGYSFSTGIDTNTGMYRVGEDQLGFATGGTVRLTVDANTAIVSTLPWRGPNGGAGGPALSFSGDTDSGFYSVSANVIGLSLGNSLKWQFGAAGQLGIGGATYGTANTQAIVSGGASAAPSWQTVLVDGQTQTLGGAKTFSSLMTLNPNGVSPPVGSVNADAALLLAKDAPISIQQLAIGSSLSLGYRFVSAGGSFGAPAAVSTADVNYMAFIGAGGYDGTNWQTGASGLWGVRPAGTWSGTSRPTRLTAESTAVGSTARRALLALDNALMVYGNSTDNPDHEFYGALHYATGLQDFADDTAAAAGGIAVNQLYRNGSVVMIRVS